MPDNPRDYLNATNSALDPLRTNSALNTAMGIARIDITTGLGAAISTSIAMRDFITPMSTLPSTSALTTTDMTLNLASLSGLRAPYDQLSTLRTADGYLGTISGLASAASVAECMQSTYPTLLETNPIASLSGMGDIARMNTGMVDAFSSVRSITPAYISSAASVYTVESALARATRVPAGVDTLFGSTILPGTSIASIGQLHNTISSISHAAQTMWDGIDRSRSIFDLVSPSILRLPAVELYASAHAAASVSLQRAALPERDSEVEEILDEASETIEARLENLDRNLVEMYRGGLHAIEIGGPDWQRHSMISFREITIQVLHKLAPDKEVIASGGELYNGRPTRHARLKFIFSSVAGGELTKFFESDMKAAVELFELLNGGTHRLGSKATPEQFYYLKGRLTGLLSSILSARGY